MPGRIHTALALSLACIAVAAPAASAAVDGLHAMNAVPPGESGLTTLPGFAGATAGLTPTYGPHTQDQLNLYATFSYKPMQFAGEGQGSPVPGDPSVTIWRDAAYGVPTITGRTDQDLWYGVGYAMASDRLFQMEAFRHVGHGTLAELTGASALAMDEQVRRVSEGEAGLMAEFDALPTAEQQLITRFVDGINAEIAQVDSNPLQLPAEFPLEGDLPIKSWTVADVLGFGEYAGRFFGEFGHGELANAAAYDHLVARYGARRAETLFNDLLPLDDPRAPTSIPAAEGSFPRHTGRPVPTTYRGSPFADHAPGELGAIAQAGPAAASIDRRQALVHSLQRLLAVPRFGSNAVIVAPRLSADHRALLYGGPQTGWSVPGYFWEAELHSPVRDERGVFVPALPVMVIGRNEHAAWTVTSALDDNESVYVDQLDAGGRYYVHDGRRLAVQKTTATLRCNNPPSGLVALTGGKLPPSCPAPKTLTLYRTIHGPALAPPDAGGRLFVRQSVVDGRLLQSLLAWDLAGRQSTPESFGRAISGMSLGFNFLYADDRGHIAYWHAGRYPILPRNADPRLPLPGDGRYDWQGFERWSAHPHVIDPPSGYIANWNNKPATGWYSPNLETGGEGGIWGDEWEVVPLAADVREGAPWSFQRFGKVPRDVAYIDNAARVLKSQLVAALATAADPQLSLIRDRLAAWDGRRDDVATGASTYSTPAVVFFDRFLEHAMSDLEGPVLGSDFHGYAGEDCAGCHLVSVDNLAAPTYKFEYAGEQLLVEALRGETAARWIPGEGAGSPRSRARRLRSRFLAARNAFLVESARDAAGELTAAQGSDPANWNEPVETGQFSAQGAISVPPLVPLQNRGSYGQVVEGGPA